VSRSAPTTEPAPNPSTEQPQATGEGRDARGRFTAGNQYGPGNPFARQTAQLRKVLLEVVTPEEMRQVAVTLVLLAKTGKLEAIKLLFHYVLGKPGAAVDPDRLEVEEWKLAQESKVNVADLHETVQHMPAETANLLVRHAWPAATQSNNVRVVEDELDAMDREDALRAREAARAEANGGDGAPPPRPLSHKGRGEQEEGDAAPARGGRHAKPQAADPTAETNGDNGSKGGAADQQRPVRPRAARGRRTEANGGNGGPLSSKGGREKTGSAKPQAAAETNGGNGDGRRRGPPPGRPR
jgi:hypothetical protein